MTVDVDALEDVTELLRAWWAGDEDALNELITRVYSELCRMARQKLRIEQKNILLETRELVHNAYERLRIQPQDFANRNHFFAIASHTMRQILVDMARKHKALKRGGSHQQVFIESMDELTSERADHFVRLDSALEALEEFDKGMCRMVELRYFGGMTMEEASRITGKSLTTLKREWNLAKAWLKREMDYKLDLVAP